MSKCDILYMIGCTPYLTTILDNTPPLAQRWANVTHDVGPTLTTDVGPTLFFPLAQRWTATLAYGWPNVGLTPAYGWLKVGRDVGPTSAQRGLPTLATGWLLDHLKTSLKTGAIFPVNIIIYIMTSSYIVIYNHKVAANMSAKIRFDVAYYVCKKHRFTSKPNNLQATEYYNGDFFPFRQLFSV